MVHFSSGCSSQKEPYKEVHLKKIHSLNLDHLVNCVMMDLDSDSGFCSDNVLDSDYDVPNPQSSPIEERKKLEYYNTLKKHVKVDCPCVITIK